MPDNPIPAAVPCPTKTDPELQASLERARHHVMTPAERDAQRRSWVRGEMMLDRPEMTADEANALMDRAGEAAPAGAVEAGPLELPINIKSYEIAIDQTIILVEKVAPGSWDLAKRLLLKFRAALPHLAAPAWDVADLVIELQQHAEMVRRFGALVVDNADGFDQCAAALIAIAAERDRANAERDGARRDLAALLTGERVIVPQTQQHAESLYAVAVTSLRAYGVDPEAERDEAMASTVDAVAIIQRLRAELDVARQQTHAAIERATDALRERDVAQNELAQMDGVLDRAKIAEARAIDARRKYEALDRTSNAELAACERERDVLAERLRVVDPNALAAAYKAAGCRGNTHEEMAVRNGVVAYLAALTQASTPETGDAS